MNAPDQQRELVRLLELDYEKTTKLNEGLVSSGFTVRGWGVALTSALIGLTFQAHLWPIAALAGVLAILIALIDGYHSWLYAITLVHAQKIENVLSLYYASLARGMDDQTAVEEFRIALYAHPFGRFAEIQKFRLANLLDARPRFVILVLYGTLLACAISAGVLVCYAGKKPTGKLECTAAANVPKTYVCIQQQ